MKKRKPRPIKWSDLDRLIGILATNRKEQSRGK